MKPMTVDALTDAANYAVVRLPGRAHPGMVIQGDSLSILYQTVLEIRLAVQKGDISVVREGIDDLCEELRGLVEWYESVLAQEGLALPYFRDE